MGLRENWFRKLGLGSSVLLAAALLSAPVLADGEEDPPPPPADEEETPDLPTNGLSESETAYTGAVMLRGNHEVTIDSVVPGYVGDESYQADGRYGYFSGNTLYAGGQDDEGNYVDLIAEFFWFESSIDRGSDFYVGVVKARTSPNLKDWVLRRETNAFVDAFLPDDKATLYLRAQTEMSGGSNAFRWDWSVPFDNYGWDAFGNITMETKYGLSINAEGSSQKAISLEEGGIPVEANVQAKGFFSKNYQVQTKYEVTLWRWEVVVHGSANQIEWQMNLHNGDREKQNAYHEFFVAMQADQGVPFKLDWLEVGGSVRDSKWYWFDEYRSLSSAVTGIVLRPPQLPPPPPSDDGEENDPGAQPPSGDNNRPVDSGNDGDGEAAGGDIHNYYSQSCAYGTSSNRSGNNANGWLAMGLLGLMAAGRRRRRSH